MLSGQLRQGVSQQQGGGTERSEGGVGVASKDAAGAGACHCPSVTLQCMHTNTRMRTIIHTSNKS